MPARVLGRGSYDIYAEALRNVPKKMRPKVRKAVVDATKEVRSEQARAASWSRRIPSALGVRVGFASPRAELRLNSRKAPHGKPYEGPGREVRWPIFGDRENWGSTATRPFFNPPIFRNFRELREAVEKAVIESLPR